MTQVNKPLGSKEAHAGETDPAHIAQIEAEIGQTRNAISGDLRTLGERLSPETLKEEAREIVMDAKNAAKETLQEAKNVATSTFREVKDSAIETVSTKVDEFRGNVREVEQEALGFVRDNAVPLALIGIGVAWFMSNRRRRDASWEGRYAPSGDGNWRYPQAGHGRDPGSSWRDSEQRFGAPRDGYSQSYGGAREAAARAKDQAQDWVEGAAHTVRDGAARVQNFAEREAAHVRDLATDAERKLGRAAVQARDSAGRGLQSAWDVSRQTTDAHPLAVGAAAVAVGLCVGLAIPTTRRENELFGAERERLMGEAKDAVQGWTDSAKDAARDVKASLGGGAI